MDTRVPHTNTLCLSRPDNVSLKIFSALTKTKNRSTRATACPVQLGGCASRSARRYHYHWYAFSIRECKHPRHLTSHSTGISSAPTQSRYPTRFADTRRHVATKPANQTAHRASAGTNREQAAELLLAVSISPVLFSAIFPARTPAIMHTAVPRIFTIFNPGPLAGTFAHEHEVSEHVRASSQNVRLRVTENWR